MDSRCYRCASKFGMFKKEIACQKCGYGFCKKCIPHLVKSQTGDIPVCEKCFQAQAAQKSKGMNSQPESSKYDVPENFKKRVAALQEKESKVSPSTISQTERSKVTANMSPADRDIAERLEKLKESKRQAAGPIPSAEDMEERLRVLKGLPAKAENNPSNAVFHPKDTRTSHEQSQDLITQITDEVKLDNNLKGSSEPDEPSGEDGASVQTSDDPTKSLEEEIKSVMDEANQELKMAQEGKERDKEMEERLAKLHGMDVQTYKDKGRKELENMSEAESTRRYIAQLLEESRLDEKVKEDGYSQVLEGAKSHYEEKAKESDPDELPWCCICNEDALVRCHGCDGDLYCKSCFREGHRDPDMKYHNVSKYKPPKGAGR